MSSQYAGRQEASRKPQFRIIHEFNPTKYYPAILDLESSGEIEIAGLHRGSVGKEWLRSWIQENKSFAGRTANSASDLHFRVGASKISGEVIMIALAPWDYRLLYYRHLARRNRILYHTSWPDWRDGRVPRNYGALDRILVRAWRSFLQHPNVDAVAVTNTAARALRSRMDLDRVTVIPHCAEEVFFAARESAVERHDGPMRLLYVGEISDKKGVDKLLDLFRTMPEKRFELTIVGDGPARGSIAARADAIPGASFLGPLRDRNRLAAVMAEHDVLMVPSQRIEGWEELFGMVIVEAMAAGLVVVASDHVGPREILADNAPETLFDEADLAGMASFVERLAADQSLLTDLRQRCASMASNYRLSHVRELWRNTIFNVDH